MSLITPHPPLGALPVWCTVILPSSPHLRRLQTVAAHVVIFNLVMCVSYSSSCYNLSAVLLLSCHCPCHQRLNLHLELHHEEEAAATYWADLLSPAKLTALACAA